MINWKGVDLVETYRPWSEHNRRDRTQRRALDRLVNEFQPILYRSELLTDAPVKTITLIVGIREAVPKPPYLLRRRGDSTEQEAVIEADWAVVREFDEDEWFRWLVPKACEAMRMIAKKYRLSLDRFEHLYAEIMNHG